MISALVSVIAKVMTLVDGALDGFVSVGSMVQPVGNGDCNVTILTGTMSCEGQALADAIQDSIYAIAGLIPNLLQGLGVYV